jgi:DNA-binding FadR family transcriptional regulator
MHRDGPEPGRSDVPESPSSTLLQEAGRIEAGSLKARCAAALERLVIAGDLPVDSTLPPEREFAKLLGVSRPVLHEAIVDLAGKGFLEIRPRHGVAVRDFWRSGTLAVFEAIVLHGGGAFAPGVLEDVVGFRALIELEAVRLAALRRAGEFAGALNEALAEEAALPPLPEAADRRTEADLRFHLLLAEASGNRILPLVVNSIRPIYESLVRRFYAFLPDADPVEGYHREVVDAILGGDPGKAVRVMTEMLDHGARAIGAGDRREGRA